MRILLYTLCIGFFNFSVFAQQIKKDLGLVVDSLIFEIQNTKNDSLKSEYLLQLSELTQIYNPDTSIYFSKQAYDLAKKINNIPVQAGALGFISTAYFYDGNLPKAVEIALESIELGKHIPGRIGGGVGPAYSILGTIYVQIGDYDRAFKYLNKLIALGENDLVGVAFGYFNLATLYEKQNKLDLAKHYLKESYEVFGALNYSFYPKVYDAYPLWYNLRARIYLKEGKPKLALADYFYTLNMTLRNNEHFFSSGSYNDIAFFYKGNNQLDSAVFFAKKGLLEAQENTIKPEIIRASEFLAEYYDTKNPAQALSYIKLANETRNSFYGAGNMQVMRDIIEKNDKKQAEIEATEKASKNRLIIGGILSFAILLLVTAIFLYRNNLTKQKAKLKIESAFDQLKSTQDQLIQSEKMASLGELTAGIAHEIQNPLNFVNNFSEVSEEMIEEVLGERLKVKGERDENLEEEILGDIKENLSKIHHHGNRASSIVKGMLEHSRTSSGKKELTDINALADEYLRLSYHGLRAKDKDFNAEMVTNFDPTLPKIEVIPQDIGRVLLNLINNAFQAVDEQAKKGIEGYKPTVTVKTGLTAQSQMLIVIKDNGTGIPDSIKDKIFQPFFTTKDTGKGTGLGLSLAYDIVKAHGGELKVESFEREGSAFIINLLLKA